MAKLSANGRFEIARVIVTLARTDAPDTVATYACLSDGWVLRKVSGTGGLWKPLERVPGVRGYGPKRSDGMLPGTDKRRVAFDDRVRVMSALADRLYENFRKHLPDRQVSVKRAFTDNG